MASESQIILQLEGLVHKTEVLTRLLAEARQRIVQLEITNSELRTASQNTDRQPKEVPKKPGELQQPFHNTKEIAKIVSDNPANMGSNAELKRKLDEYIQEIDRCIAYLSNLS